MSSDDVRMVTRELRLIYYNNYLLKVGAITNRQHRLIYKKIIKCTSVRKLINDNVTH